MKFSALFIVIFITSSLSVIPASAQKRDTLIRTVAFQGYYDLEIVGQRTYCNSFGVEEVGRDTTIVSFDLGCSIFYENLRFSNVSLDSLKLEIAVLDYITYTITPSDGFETASLSDTNYVSYYQPMSVDSGVYKPYNYITEDFIFSQKPELTEPYLLEQIALLDKELDAGLTDSYLNSDREFYWESCGAILRISGKTKSGTWVYKYLYDDTFCIQD